MKLPGAAAPLAALLAAVLGCGVTAPASARTVRTATSAAPTTASVAPSASAGASASASASASMVAPVSQSASASASASAAPARRKIVLRPGAKFALVGDSMVHAGLSQAFEKRLKDVGGTLVHDSWASSKLHDWAITMRLPNLMFAQRPDAVFIVVGTNEVHFKAPHMDEDVRAIVARFGATPCVLIGPPVWDYQAGIVDALRDNAGHCAFVDSTNFRIRRQKDGIHPSLEGGKAWTDEIFAATVE